MDGTGVESSTPGDLQGPGVHARGAGVGAGAPQGKRAGSRQDYSRRSGDLTGNGHAELPVDGDRRGAGDGQRVALDPVARGREGEVIDGNAAGDDHRAASEAEESIVVG